jgi:chromosome partitioning protein
MTRIIAIANHAGGVAKTTTTLNLGHALAEQGSRVLLVDFDPQASLTESLGFNPDSLEYTIHNLVLETQPGLTVAEVIQKTQIPGLSLLPSRIDLAKAESQLFSEYKREQILADLLQPVLPLFDFVIIDCQPSLGILPTNALTAASEILIPVTSDPKAFRALKQLLETVAGFRRKLNPSLHLSGIVVTNHDGRTQLGRQMLELLREEYPQDVLPVVIPRSVRTQESSALGKSILTYQPASPVSQAYRELALELTKHAHAA